MKKLKALLLALLAGMSLISCGGGDAKADISSNNPVPHSNPVSHNGAWNSSKDYIRESSELQTLVDNQDYIKLPCGTYNGSVIELRSGVWIEGSGKCTKIPSVKTPNERTHYIKISNLTIDGNIDGYNNIGIDFTNCSICRVNNVVIGHVDYGVLLYGQSYYNSLADMYIRAHKECFEIVGVANANVINRGVCQGETGSQSVAIGLVAENVNSLKILSTSFENLGKGMVLKSGSNTTLINGIRCEAMDICVELQEGSRQTTIIASHVSQTVTKIKSESSSQYKYLGF